MILALEILGVLMAAPVVLLLWSLLLLKLWVRLGGTLALLLPPRERAPLPTLPPDTNAPGEPGHARTDSDANNDVDWRQRFGIAPTMPSLIPPVDQSIKPSASLPADEPGDRDQMEVEVEDRTPLSPIPPGR